MGFFDLPRKGNGKKASFSFEKKFEWFVRHEFLKQNVEELVMDEAKRIGKVIEGYAVQCISHMPNTVDKRLASNDPETIRLFKRWGMDHTKPASQQDIPKIQEVVDEYDAQLKEEAA